MRRRFFKRRSGLIAIAVFALPSIGHSNVFDGNAVQSSINAAIASGASTLTLPNGTIRLTRSLTIPRGTRNFTLRGGPRTRIVRATNFQTPLLTLGLDGQSGYSNTPLFSFPNVPLQPIADGANTIDLVSPTTIPRGWYVVAGENPTQDFVQISSGTRFANKRELVYVQSQAGLRLTLDRPLGREYVQPRLFQLETESTPPSERVVLQNIRIEGIWLDGRLGEIDTGRSTPVGKAPLAVKCLSLEWGAGFSMQNVRISGFRQAGASLMLSRDIDLRNLNLFDAQLSVAAYGIEFLGCRTINIQDSSLQDVRLGFVFSSGTMDAYVFNCRIPAGRGAFDVSHGVGERRITFEQCVAPEFILGNGSWLAGGQDLRLIDCTALNQIQVQGNTQNILIQGMHPDYSITAPRILWRHERNPSGFPAGPVWPLSAVLDGVVLRNFVYAGRASQFTSGSSDLGPRIGTVEIRNSLLENPFVDGVESFDVGANNVSGQLIFRNTVLRTQAMAPSFVLRSTQATGGWDVTFDRVDFQTAGNVAAALEAGARGTFRFQNSRMNGSLLLPGMVQNQSGGTANVQFTP